MYRKAYIICGLKFAISGSSLSWRDVEIIELIVSSLDEQSNSI